MYASGGKRLCDLVLALAMAVPALLLCLGCVVAIRREDAGPALFRQTRVGRDRRPFTLYKLRTMSTGTGDRASHEVSTAQITRVGRVLRRTKLDELPQLINVLKGDMSFVGPRPCLPSQEALVTERDRRGVYAVRPGITGPAQLAGIDMSTPVELAQADALYAARIRFTDDLRYIVRTATGGGSGDAVKNG
ncbi:MAG: sugar transferase [Rhizobiales bacterium]|nr:sugar transferase [Hyphomicrobiales bacterium]